MTTGHRRRSRPPRARLAAMALATTLGLIAVPTLAGCTGEPAGRAPAAEPSTTAQRQAEVARRGAGVMPFDLERTTHRFAKHASGGVQTVVADDPGDAEQIRLIRQHLRHEVAEFRQGRFTDPARIHGGDMPGLAVLRGHGGRMSIEYTDTADGARVTYRTTDTDLVNALHSWFDAQVTDHGSHAHGG